MACQFQQHTHSRRKSRQPSTYNVLIQCACLGAGKQPLQRLPTTGTAGKTAGRPCVRSARVQSAGSAQRRLPRRSCRAIFQRHEEPLPITPSSHASAV
ncbi:hypothetical protein FKM82_030213 [Ascaphus truei]